MRDKIVVSASRKEEKILQAPASVMVVDGKSIGDQRHLTVADLVRTLPGVDYVQTGLTQTNVVARGFNNVASGALLSFVDNRISRLPSLRFNTHNFIPLTVDDIDRIEVVLGPTALYGPNSASGVMNIITRSPFDSKGTTLHSGGGERNLRTFYIRHAQVLNDAVAFKISAGHYFATDWKYEDPEEVRLRGFNPRDYTIKRKTAELRFDLRPMEDLSLVLSAGYTQASNIEMTSVGAAQAKNWTYNFLQARLRFRDFFAQMYYNRSDDGETMRLRSNEPVVDRSTLAVLQAQHALSVGENLQFTYGLDVLTTMPKTDGTISGIYEDRDKIQIVGLYLQSELALGEHWDLALAGRYDNHNHIKNPVFSPRAALVFNPTEEQSVRLTYNRAFGTPTSTNLFLDILSSKNPFGVGIDLRAQGPFQGFTFHRDANQLPMFRSPFAALVGVEESDYIPLNDPRFNNAMWQVGRNQTLVSLLPTLRQIAAERYSPDEVEALLARFESAVPRTLPDLKNDLRVFDLAGQTFIPLQQDSLSDIPRLKQNITETFELGYKAVVGNKLLLTLDLYRNRKTDFVSQFNVETPNVFLDSITLTRVLSEQLSDSLLASDAVLDAVLSRLDDVDQGGNGNGGYVDELSRLFVLGDRNNGSSFLPLGTVSPDQATDPTAVILTYRNLGQVTIYGLDVGMTYYASDTWTIAGNYSHLNENQFPTRSLNAPLDKFNLGSSYQHPETGVRLTGWLRHRGPFPMSSGVYSGQVAGSTVIDVDVAYDLPIHSPDASATLSLNVSNVFDRRHQEFVGAPEIGRLVSGGLTVRF
ncbi:MAG: TonB-dependent receptor [bacterium]|nr:TonB-dependent receptor [bacterium]